MATASAVLRTAAAEIGYQEKYKNITKYWADLKPSYQGGAWCLAFVQWCLKKNGMWLDVPLPYYVPSAVAWAKEHGRWRAVGTYTPKPGDLQVMGDEGRYQHIGFVEEAQARGVVQSIEGNTSSGIIGSQNNGEGVYRRRRSSWIRGYIVMTYTVPARSLVPYPGHQHADATNDDHHVYQIQTRLKQLGLYTDKVDSHFGPNTTRAVKRFQVKNGLEADGWVGRNTWNKLKIYNRA